MLVSQILKDKGDLVFTASPDETVAAAAALLHSRRVGAMVVVDGQDHGRRHRLRARHGARASPSRAPAALSQPVSSCMTHDVIFAEPDETVDVLLERMTDRRIRHLPVLQGRPAGRHRLDRRPGEEQDRRDRGRGRGPEGLYRRRLRRLRLRPARQRSLARRPADGVGQAVALQHVGGGVAGLQQGSRSAQVARSGQSSHLRNASLR